MDIKIANDSWQFWKKSMLTILFFVLSPLTIAVSFFSLIALNPVDIKQTTDIFADNLIETPKSGVKVYASLPLNSPSIAGEVIPADARAEIVKIYLQYFQSPLVPYAQKIVDEAIKVGIDFRLITAIAQQESNLCKKIPPDTNNCWGWGIHSAGTLGFSSFSEGIEIVTKGLKENYIDLGLVTPEQIMSKYTPSSNGSWAKGVREFMSEMN